MLNPTGRAKNGVKRSLLVEADGGPLAVVVARANVRDDKLLTATLDAIVVEPTLGWLSKYRAILVHYQKKATNSLGLIKVAYIPPPTSSVPFELVSKAGPALGSLA